MSWHVGQLRRVLGERNVVLMWVAGVVSSTGTGAMFVALPFYTFTRTGSVLLTAAVTLAEYAPAVGIAQLAGLISDCHDPRQVLVAANAGLAVCTLGYLLDQHWWWLAVVAFLRSCISQFLGPASSTLIPAFVPAGAPAGRLAQLNGLLAIGSNLARLTGPAIGGTLVAAGGLNTVAVVDAASFAAAAVLTALLRLPRRLPCQPDPAAAAAEGLLLQWRSGWMSLRHNPVLAPLVWVMVCVGVGEGFVSALIAPWMRDIAGGTSTQLGLMLSLQALGGILGGLLVIRTGSRNNSLALLTVGALASSLMLAVIFNYPLIANIGPWPAIILTALAGLPFAVYGTAESICVQNNATDGFRGRTTSLTYGSQQLAQLLGIAAAGLLGQAIGPLAINAETLGYLTAGILAYTTMHKLKGTSSTGES